MAKIKNISALNKFKEHESTLKYANSTIELTDLKTLVENGIKFFSTRLKNKIKRTENSKLSSELKIIECFEDNYFINEYLLLLDKINIRLKLTSFETIKNYKFFKVQTLPFEKNNTTFEIFEKIISEKFATFGIDGFHKPFLIELIESYYNEMLQKSIELQRTFENQTQLTKNFNRLCIDWLNYILERYNEANIKEAPHYIKPFLDYCKAKVPKQTEVEKNESKTNYLGQPTNENANDFFEFLIDHYRPTEATVVKFVNILHYLKNDTDKSKFIFKVKQKDYKKLVFEKKGIKINKFQKSERYFEDERTILNALENSFLKIKTGKI